MQHHERNYIAAATAQRRATADRRRLAQTSELAQLVRRAAANDEAAWTAIVRCFSGRLRRVAGAHALSSEDVEDVVQSTFIRLHAHIHELRNADALSGWLATTARRKSLWRRRAGARVSPADPELFDT